MVVEILGSIIATSTAQSVIKFMDEKVGEYINKKFGNKPPPSDIEALKKEVQELKEKLDVKKREEINQVDIDQLKNTMTKIEQKQSYLPDKIISNSIFQEWSSKEERDVEDQVTIIKKELEIIFNRTRELKIPERKRWEIQDMIIAIDINLKEMNDAKREAKKFRGLVSAEQKAKEAEIGLRNTIFEAANYLKPYFE